MVYTRFQNLVRKSRRRGTNFHYHCNLTGFFLLHAKLNRVYRVIKTLMGIAIVPFVRVVSFKARYLEFWVAKIRIDASKLEITNTSVRVESELMFNIRFNVEAVQWGLCEINPVSSCHLTRPLLCC